MANSVYDTYVSPLSTSYASTEMKYNFSDRKKFTTWRTLWTLLAQAEQVIFIPSTVIYKTFWFQTLLKL